MVTVLDVLENFFDIHNERDILKISGGDIYRLGEEVRRFANNYTPPPIIEYQNPIYLGGWPSANFWLSVHSDLIMSCLLFAGQVLVKDPISDWFSDEQYTVRSFQTSRKGYFDIEKNQINMLETRAFLHHTIPRLIAIKPLIDSGIIVLVPSKQFESENRKGIELTTEKVLSTILTDYEYFTSVFHPVELAVDDTRRGYFVFAGGEKEKQIQKQVRNSIYHFLSEYCLSTEYGYSYTAPFKYERFLCEKGINGLMAETFAGTKVIQSLLNTELPIYSGLNPDLIVTMKNDEDYSSFREDLANLYKDFPIKEDKINQKKWLKDQEGTYLFPKLDKIKKSIHSGSMSKLGITTTKSIFSVLSSLFIANYCATTGNAPLSLALEFFKNLILNSIPTSQSNQNNRVWTMLYKHKQTPKDIITSYRKVLDTKPETHKYWGIAENPSMNVQITNGILLADFIPDFLEANYPIQNPPKDTYDLCPCGSGLKYRFCCQEIKDKKPFLITKKEKLLDIMKQCFQQQPYISLEVLKATMEKIGVKRGDTDPLEVTPETRRKDIKSKLKPTDLIYLQELKQEGKIFDAGRGWYSSIADPFILDYSSVRRIVSMISKKFPLLDFSCWSTEQISRFGHHLLTKFVTFLYTDRDNLNHLCDFLIDEGFNVYSNPNKEESKDFIIRKKTIVLRPTISTQPVEEHFVKIEGILTELFLESIDLNLIDFDEYIKIFHNLSRQFRISISQFLDYIDYRQPKIKNKPSLIINLVELIKVDFSINSSLINSSRFI